MVVGEFQGDKEIVIRGGLVKGDRVVIDGVMKVVPGQPVTVTAPGTATPAAPAVPAAAAPAAKAPDAAKK